ncbi:MAG: 1-acyl-sn-glycerol-3-phosphate acyltransferase [Bacteriovoracaceae bacterium]
MIRQICTLIIKLSGWKMINRIPDNLRSFVLIGAPHTSNYDFVPAMALSYLLKRNTKFVIKNEWTKFPLNLILGPAGAIGLDREKIKKQHMSTTDSMANLFNQYSELVLMISPEGTRKPVEHWKTGFYYIAQKAKVPLVLASADYRLKELVVDKVIYPNDFNQDMKIIMDFYRNIQGKIPENFKLDSDFA